MAKAHGRHARERRRGYSEPSIFGVLRDFTELYLMEMIVYLGNL